MAVRKLGDTELDFLGAMLYEEIFIPEGQDPLYYIHIQVWRCGNCLFLES